MREYMKRTTTVIGSTVISLSLLVGGVIPVTEADASESNYTKNNYADREQLHYISQLHHIVHPIGTYLVKEKLNGSDHELTLFKAEKPLKLYDLEGNYVKKIKKNHYYYIMKNGNKKTNEEGLMLDATIHYGDRYYLSNYDGLSLGSITLDTGLFAAKQFNSIQKYAGELGAVLVDVPKLSNAVTKLENPSKPPPTSFNNHSGLNYHAYRANETYRKGLDKNQGMRNFAEFLSDGKLLVAGKSTELSLKNTVILFENSTTAKTIPELTSLIHEKINDTPINSPIHYGIASNYHDGIYTYTIILTQVAESER